MPQIDITKMGFSHMRKIDITYSMLRAQAQGACDAKRRPEASHTPHVADTRRQPEPSHTPIAEQH